MKKIYSLAVLSATSALFACGQTPDSPATQTPNITPQIVNGVESEPHSRPYATLVGVPVTDKDGNKKLGWCGGVLISKEWVMTVAHCVKRWKADEFVIRVGVHNRHAEPPEGEQLSVSKRIFHPQVDTTAPWNTGHDIGLLKLSKPVSDPNAIPVNLPSDRIESILDQHQSRAIILGWGLTADDGKNSSPVLRETNIPISPNALCIHPEDTDPSARKPANMICGLPEDGKDTCVGDSGSPVVQSYQGKTYVLGMPSYTHVCGDGYSKYTRINSYTHWIKKHTGIDAEAQDSEHKPLMLGYHRHVSSSTGAIISKFSKRKWTNSLPTNTKTILINTANIGKDADKTVFRMIVSNKSNKKICDFNIKGDSKTFCRVDIKDANGLKVIHQNLSNTSHQLNISYFAETK